MALLSQIIPYILKYKKYLLYIALVLSALMIFNTFIDSFKSISSVMVKQNKGFKADYNSDMNFLDCLSVQHSCVYANIQSGNQDFIIANCGEEQLCMGNKGVRVIGKR